MLDSTEEEGKHFTKSVNNKVTLRSFFEKWRGEFRYIPAELQEGVNLEELLGLNATLFIFLNETEERTYANIESVLPYKDKNGDMKLYALKPRGQYTRVIEREGYKEPKEFAEAVNNGHA